MFKRPILFLMLASAPMSGAWSAGGCGASINDWCTGLKDGACGAHMNEAACKSDEACMAARYSGESLVACHWDERGFADNCPAVGCRDRKGSP